MSEEDLIKQINYLKEEITRLNGEFKDKTDRTKQEIENKYNTEINELKSRITRLNKVDDKETIKNLEKEIKGAEKSKFNALKERLNEIKNEEKNQIKKIKVDLKVCEKTLITLRKSKLTQTFMP